MSVEKIIFSSDPGGHRANFCYVFVMKDGFEKDEAGNPFIRWLNFESNSDATKNIKYDVEHGVRVVRSKGPEYHYLHNMATADEEVSFSNLKLAIEDRSSYRAKTIGLIKEAVSKKILDSEITFEALASQFPKCVYRTAKEQCASELQRRSPSQSFDGIEKENIVNIPVRWDSGARSTVNGIWGSAGFKNVVNSYEPDAALVYALSVLKFHPKESMQFSVLDAGASTSDGLSAKLVNGKVIRGRRLACFAGSLSINENAFEVLRREFPKVDSCILQQSTTSDQPPKDSFDACKRNFRGDRQKMRLSNNETIVLEAIMKEIFEPALERYEGMIQWLLDLADQKSVVLVFGGIASNHYVRERVEKRFAPVEVVFFSNSKAVAEGALRQQLGLGFPKATETMFAKETVGYLFWDEKVHKELRNKRSRDVLPKSKRATTGEHDNGDDKDVRVTPAQLKEMYERELECGFEGYIGGVILWLQKKGKQCKKHVHVKSSTRKVVRGLHNGENEWFDVGLFKLPKGLPPDTLQPSEFQGVDFYSKVTRDFASKCPRFGLKFVQIPVNKLPKDAVEVTFEVTARWDRSNWMTSVDAYYEMGKKKTKLELIDYEEFCFGPLGLHLAGPVDRYTIENEEDEIWPDILQQSNTTDRPDSSPQNNCPGSKDQSPLTDDTSDLGPVEDQEVSAGSSPGDAFAEPGEPPKKRRCRPTKNAMPFSYRARTGEGSLNASIQPPQDEGNPIPQNAERETPTSSLSVLAEEVSEEEGEEAATGPTTSGGTAPPRDLSPGTANLSAATDPADANPIPTQTRRMSDSI